MNEFGYFCVQSALDYAPPPLRAQIVDELLDGSEEDLIKLASQGMSFGSPHTDAAILHRLALISRVKHRVRVSWPPPTFGRPFYPKRGGTLS